MWVVGQDNFDKGVCVGLWVRPWRWGWGDVDKGVSWRINLKGVEQSDWRRECLSRAVAGLPWASV